ncbi:TylF/MycF/NovP-related O-methyltransferase [Fontimonas sp. SYSU GA230001]|uniref:TylF/MycF/NovP-related O-methyltransferase n=1 Tax=Fontimonas sp. SYSU GA230001 TaxID=3142450 RepID=UPI0032B4BAA0
MSRFTARLRSAAKSAYSELRGRPFASAADRMQASIIASAADKRIAEAVRGQTMTNPLRVHALIDAVDYVCTARVPGAFVECGVWRGGSVLAMLLKLIDLGITDRDVWLYDTFEGMTAPSAADTSAFEAPAMDTWNEARKQGKRGWDRLFAAEVYNEDTVRALLLSSGYPSDRLHFVKGPVEQTIPATVPGGIALLRLDTDWYESTRHELEHLYPLLAKGGVLIIDDYGHWEGCRRAVDEYFAAHPPRPLLNRIDYNARIGVRV